MFDVIVVGKGLFGSSAVKYLSGLVERVAVIGPEEPAGPEETADLGAHEGVFGAHYDEGRLTYRSKVDGVWAGLAAASLARFPAIEAGSGVDFYSPAGYLYVANGRMDDGTLTDRRVGPVEVTALNGVGLGERFPYLNFAADCRGLWEGAPAGHFSPRRFIRAQMALARGVTVVDDVATAVEVVGAEGVVVRTARGGRFEGEKVLVAAGAYSNGFGLLERPLDLRLKQEFVIRALVSEGEAARLGRMPVVVYRVDHPRLEDLYILPPIRYPDGRYYLKMGANTALDGSVETVEEINDWYRAGRSEMMAGEMRAMVEEIFPGLRAEGWSMHRCVITRTAHGRPYIDGVVPGRVFVAVGGNGQGAKTADEVGRLAARLVAEVEGAEEAFAAIFKEVV